MVTSAAYQFLSDDQAASSGKFNEEPTRPELERFFYEEGADSTASPAAPVKCTPAPGSSPRPCRGRPATHELGDEPDAYGPRLNVDFTPQRGDEPPTEVFSQAA
ncbi:hypothetical protein [Streptomyces sp. VB1]|uniref:hypothetical protein n=1 Tax=Streptomyces sp. VB1 TaxID=2986803 RepID=UPI00224242DE|nr:hypothetical protein [Streptomyces sp. VB1]UZI26828.1 hypothetical protein OH133_01150 [Streptomyces sp. VB1]